MNDQKQPTALESSGTDQFIEFRARGLSFAKIAARLKVTRKTLFAWSRKCQYQIQNARSS